MLNRAGVGAGDDVLVTGASGGVGTGLVQLARRRGARVLGLTSSGKADSVREIGADEIVARDEEELSTVLEGWTEDGRVDVVADVVGGESFQEFLESLRPGGGVVTAGAVAGPVTEIDLRTVYLKQVDVVGSTMGTRSEFRTWSAISRMATSSRYSPRRTRSPKSTRRNVTSPGAITSGTSSWSRKRPLVRCAGVNRREPIRSEFERERSFASTERANRFHSLVKESVVSGHIESVLLSPDHPFSLE